MRYNVSLRFFFLDIDTFGKWAATVKRKIINTYRFLRLISYFIETRKSTAHLDSSEIIIRSAYKRVYCYVDLDSILLGVDGIHIKAPPYNPHDASPTFTYYFLGIRIRKISVLRFANPRVGHV